MRTTRALVCIIICFLISGCNTIGPRSISNGRSDYNRALVKSDREQLLLNLVRLRYHDTPQFIEVSGITAAYELITNPSLAGTLGATGEPGPLVGGIGVTIKEKPTITYTPLQGKKFITQMLSPISGEKLVLLAQSTRDVETVMRLALQVVGTEKNLVPNAPTAAGPRPKDPPEFKDFQTLSNALSEMQRSGCIQFVWTPAKEAETSEVKDELKPKDGKKLGQDVGFNLDKRTVTSTRETKRAQGGQIDILLSEGDKDKACLQQLQEIYRLLGFAPKKEDRESWTPSEDIVTQLKIIFDRESYIAEVSDFKDRAESEAALAVKKKRPEIKGKVLPVFWEARSIYSILWYLSNGVERPGQDEEHWRHMLLKGLLEIKLSKENRKPDNAFVAVRYRGHWFYIDNEDYPSKDTFGMLSQMIALQAGEIKSQTPIPTISVN